MPPPPPSSSIIATHYLLIQRSPMINQRTKIKGEKDTFYELTTAENGQKALELLGLVEGQYSKSTRETNINLIITDYCMPGMTGNDLLKRVKGSSNLKEIHVVIVSSENVPTRIKKYKVLKNFC
ncbi:two-component response regulator ORR4-like [Nicotiana tabacum]|uniref:Two-component response regulator ORR4-like n=1 Tax=Nicotiana tabacum TaxID=4097 RepID=A0AC58S4E9_TOBAC